MIKFTPFTEDDWQGFAGAEGWNCEESSTEPAEGPRIGEIELNGSSCNVILDKNGIWIHFEQDNEPREICFKIWLPSATAMEQAAQIMLAEVTTLSQLEEIGFESL